jgi:probable rRNA maturation factor
LSLKVTALDHGVPGTDVRKLGAWLSRIAPASARGEVTIVVVADSAIRRLNRRFRGIDKVTDVLSFPEGQAKGRVTRGKGRVTRAEGRGASYEGRGKGRPFLGEIVVARGLAIRQARAYGHPVATELRILALHGLLHLLGYDHDVDRGEMARLETRLRRRAGLPTGLIARAS